MSCRDLIWRWSPRASSRPTNQDGNAVRVCPAEPGRPTDDSGGGLSRRGRHRRRFSGEVPARDASAIPGANRVTRHRKLNRLTFAVALAMAGPALAESPLATERPAATGETPSASGPAERPTRWMPLSRFGMTLAAGGGVTELTGGGTRALTQFGGSWDVRLAFRTRRLVGFEVSSLVAPTRSTAWGSRAAEPG